MTNYRLPRLTEVRHVRQHVLWLRYSDGVQGEVDLGEDLNGPVLEQLCDVSEFARAGIEQGHLVWPNGADWSPEDLRERLGASYECVLHSIDDGPIDTAGQISDVPEICRFYGIVIRMFANDHAPPHFHAEYGGHDVAVTISDATIAGDFPARARRMVLEWRAQHESELMANWDLLRSGQSPRTIAPLD